MTTDYIDDGAIQAAIERHDDPDHPDALTVPQVRQALDAVQDSVEEVWGEHCDAIEDGHVELVAHDSDGVLVLADHTGQGWNEEIDALEREGIIDADDQRAAHRVLASIHHEAASERCDRSWSAAEAFVVALPRGARDGQRFVEAIIHALHRRGLTTAQAWHYYGVRIRGRSQSTWAAMSGRDQSTISAALAKAADYE